MVTLKPAEFKAKGMKVAAKKAMYDIDTATTEILLNDSTMEGNQVTIPASQCTNENLKTLYSKYLTSVNKISILMRDTYHVSQNEYLILKGGTLVRFYNATSGNNFQTPFAWFPGDTSNHTVTFNCGAIVIDLNDNGSPNEYGTDRFWIPLNRNGIAY